MYVADHRPFRQPQSLIRFKVLVKAARARLMADDGAPRLAKALARQAAGALNNQVLVVRVAPDVRSRV